MSDTLVVFSCDENYFPLAKGLVLSLRPLELARKGIDLAFIDNGCHPQSLDWFRANRIHIATLDDSVLGAFVTIQGRQRSQVCRPLLPRLFPAAQTLIWLDSDLWIQNLDAVTQLAGWASSNPDRLFICPEWHYSYLNLNLKFVESMIAKVAADYRATYEARVVEEMSGLPVYNCGVFSMAAANPLWEAWRVELETQYARTRIANSGGPLYHMGEQLAINIVAYRSRCAVPVDPSFNYICNWGIPRRDAAGILRVPLPPANPLDVIHLANWSLNRQLYMQNRLLYQDGAYLTDEEKQRLLGSSR